MLHTSPVPKETCVHQPVGLCSTPVLYPRRLVYISLWACAPHQSCTQGYLCTSACGLVLHTSPVPKETCVHQPVGLCSTPVLYPRRLNKLCTSETVSRLLNTEHCQTDSCARTASNRMHDNGLNDLDNKRGTINTLTRSTNDWKGWPEGGHWMVGVYVDGFVSSWMRESVRWKLRIRI